MVLVDHQIRTSVNGGRLGIENFDEQCLQPASYDLRIGPLVYSPSTGHPDKPINLSQNGGWHRIPPYGNAILMTYETLRLPNNMIGRFGLKSGFARKGLFASTGPQVDPGFEGKLFVSVLNLTPASHVISFKDTFLSIEFHTLRSKPEKTYDGPYQNRTDIGRDILDDIVKMEGVNLSQMQNQFGELSQHVKEWGGIAVKFEAFLQQMENQTNMIARLVEKMAESRSPSTDEEPVIAREITLKDAKREIISLFHRKGRLFYSDIAEELNLSYSMVIKACEQLEKEGIIEGDAGGKKRTQKARKKN